MNKLLCKSCSKVFYGDIKDLITGKTNEKLACPRCRSKNYFRYSSCIKRYHVCNTCKHHFKITEVSARYIWRYGQKPNCSTCKSHITSRSTKAAYLKQSGQQKKLHRTEETILDEYNNYGVIK